MKAELQKLIALQNLDTTIRKLEKDQQAIPERRAEIEREFDQRAFEIRALENRRDEAKHTRARLENEVVEQRGRAERAERNLMSSKKQDEYTAAIREADAARKQISALETQILEQMESTRTGGSIVEGTCRRDRQSEFGSRSEAQSVRRRDWNDRRPSSDCAQRARRGVCESAETDERSLLANQRSHSRWCGSRGSAQSFVYCLFHGAAATDDGRDSTRRRSHYLR